MQGAQPVALLAVLAGWLARWECMPAVDTAVRGQQLHLLPVPAAVSAVPAASDDIALTDPQLRYAAVTDDLVARSMRRVRVGRLSGAQQSEQTAVDKQFFGRLLLIT